MDQMQSLLARMKSGEVAENPKALTMDQGKMFLAALYERLPESPAIAPLGIKAQWAERGDKEWILKVTFP